MSSSHVSPEEAGQAFADLRPICFMCSHPPLGLKVSLALVSKSVNIAIIVVMNKVLDRKFYTHKPEKVAKSLLGQILVRHLDGKILTGRIVECEAYLAFDDEASHNYHGQSERNKSMYKSGGHIYVHTSRHHTLMDIVTEGEDQPSSVLIRAIEPMAGLEIMKQARGRVKLEQLTNGPGKLCQAFHIIKEMDGLDITYSTSKLYIIAGEKIPEENIGVSGRIGITKAIDKPLRFWLKSSPFISRKPR